MNNQQFRRLILSQSSPTSASEAASTPTINRDGRGVSALGSRQRSSIPMTPRAVGGSGRGIDFAKQLRQSQEPARKKIKASSAPKGSQLAAGYQDRSKALREQSENAEIDAKVTRIKALEEQLKLGQIDQLLFESLRDEIVGGDIENVHLVKGLDRKLLERVRRGEDVHSKPTSTDENGPNGSEEREQDVDAALDQLEDRELKPLQHDEKSYARDMAPPSAPTSRKRTRDEIIREMKASRAQTTQDKGNIEQILGSKFRKIGAPQANKSRVEVDEKGREVILVEDKHGNIKRKVRKVKGGDIKPSSNGLLMPDQAIAPLGMSAPEMKPGLGLEENNDNGDIFADAGSDYNPLGEEDGDSDVSDNDSGSQQADREDAKNAKADTVDQSMSRSRSQSHSESHSRSRSTSRHSFTKASPPLRPHGGSRSEHRIPASRLDTSAPRNYFGPPASSSIAADQDGQASKESNPLQDPGMLAALKRAAGIPSSSDAPDGSRSSKALEADAAKRKRHAAMLASASADRDLEDMDLGFGSSRVGDDEGEDGKVSEWRGLGRADGEDDGSGYKERGGTKQRKRGKKKRQGKGDNAKDVLAVLDRRNR